MLYFVNFITLRHINNLLCGVHIQAEMQPIPHSELTDLEEIGQGGFGVVYKQSMHDLAPLSTKNLMPEN